MGQRTRSKKKLTRYSELDSLLSRLEDGETIYLTRHGSSVGVVVNIETYASYKAAFDLLQKMKIAYQAVKNHLDFLDGRSDGIDIDALPVDQENGNDQSE